MLGLLSGFKWFDNPRFMGAEGQQTAKWLQIDFMGKRNLWFAISGAIILAGVDLARRARPQPRDRLQGRDADHVQRRTQPYSQAQVTAFMAQHGQPDAVVQGRGTAADGDSKQLAGPYEVADRPSSSEPARRPEERARRLQRRA